LGWRKYRPTFENTAKIGSSYFQNFIGSQYKLDENGQKVENENAYKPNAVRSMCCRLQLDLRIAKRGNGLFGSAK
jgi:ribonucleoside-triphosphate reductase